MRAYKAAFALTGSLALFQFVSVYYNTSQFDYAVRREAERSGGSRQIKSAILIKAKDYSLPVQESDINVTKSGPVLRVVVDYRVPVNLFLVNPELKFHAIGSGYVRREE
jgi:hypothetical protein